MKGITITSKNIGPILKKLKKKLDRPFVYVSYPPRCIKQKGAKYSSACLCPSCIFYKPWSKTLYGRKVVKNGLVGKLADPDNPFRLYKSKNFK